MSTESRLDALEAKVAELSGEIDVIEAKVAQVVPLTDEERFMAVVDALVIEHGWTREEAGRNFANLLMSPEVQAQIAAESRP